MYTCGCTFVARRHLYDGYRAGIRGIIGIEYRPKPNDCGHVRSDGHVCACVCKTARLKKQNERVWTALRHWSSSGYHSTIGSRRPASVSCADQHEYIFMFCVCLEKRRESFVRIEDERFRAIFRRVIICRTAAGVVLMKILRTGARGDRPPRRSPEPASKMAAGQWRGAAASRARRSRAAALRTRTRGSPPTCFERAKTVSRPRRPCAHTRIPVTYVYVYVVLFTGNLRGKKMYSNETHVYTLVQLFVIRNVRRTVRGVFKKRRGKPWKNNENRVAIHRNTPMWFCDRIRTNTKVEESKTYLTANRRKTRTNAQPRPSLIRIQIGIHLFVRLSYYYCAHANSSQLT